MTKALGIVAFLTAVYATLATLYVVGAVASGLPAGMWTSATVIAVWVLSAALIAGSVLLVLRRRYAGVVLTASSVAIAIIGFVSTVQSFRVGDNLELICWLLVVPTLLAIMCAAGSVALPKDAQR